MRYMILLLCLTVFYCRAQDVPRERRIDSVLVSVNGKPISLMDIVHESRPEEVRLSYLYKGEQLYEAVKSLRLKTMNEIIKRYLILDDFEKNPYEIPVQLVESMLDDLAVSFGCNSRSELIAKAKESGTSLDELRRKARERLIIQSMTGSYCYRNVHLTPRDIHEYYTANKEKFAQPSRLSLSVIYLKNDRADLERCRRDIDEKLKESPENFAALARLYTNGINADRGGDLGWVEEKGLRPEFKEVLKKMTVGGVSAPVITDEGCYYLRMTGKEEEAVQDFKLTGAKLYKEIEAKMREEAITRYVEGLKKDAIIRYGE